jgi:hypothetical protein
MYSLVCLVHLGGEDTVSARLKTLGAAVASVIKGSFNGGEYPPISALPTWPPIKR